MKKGFWAVSALLLLLCVLILPTGARAAEIVDSGSCGDDLTWSLDQNGLLTISGTGLMTDFTASYDGKPAPWYEYRYSITSVVLPLGLTSIGDYAFYRCIYLQEVTIPGSVEQIGTYAFYECKQLKTLQIEEGVWAIRNMAFTGCTALTQVTLPDSLGQIGSAAFESCNKLTHITFGRGLQYLRSNALRYCYALRDITFRGAAPVIDMQNFPAVLLIIHVPKDSPSWQKDHFPMTSAKIQMNFCDPFCDHQLDSGIPVAPTCTEHGGTEYLCSCGYRILENRLSPNGHTEVSESIIVTCTEAGSITNYCSVCNTLLSEAYIPALGHQYENGACTRCGQEKISDIVAEGCCGENLYFVLRDSGQLRISGTGAMYDYVTFGAPWHPYKSQISSIVMEDGITHIGDYSFNSCGNLESVTWADSIVSIGANAFGFCTSLLFTALPENLQEIDNCAFQSCDRLEFLWLPDSVTQVGSFAFSDCKKLIWVSFPDGVHLQACILENCQQLWHIFFRGVYTSKDLSFITIAYIHELCPDGKVTTTVTEATCRVSGILTYRCNFCNDTTSFSTPLAAHDWKSPTCTDPKTCRACGITEGDPPGGQHTWDAGIVIQAPVGNQVGVRQHTCTRCGDTMESLFQPPDSEPTAEPGPSPESIFLLIVGSVVIAIIGTAALVSLKQRLG